MLGGIGKETCGVWHITDALEMAVAVLVERLQCLGGEHRAGVLLGKDSGYHHLSICHRVCFNASLNLFS